MSNSAEIHFDCLIRDPEGDLQKGEIFLDSDARDVWGVVGDFHGFHKFITGLESIERIGEGVRCLRKKNFSDGNVVVEQLNSIDDESMRMTWSMIYTSFDIGNLWSRMSVFDVEGGRSRVVWEIVGEPYTGTREEYAQFIDDFLEMAMSNLREMFSSSSNG